MFFLVRAWQGEATLFNAFWFLYFLLGMLVKVAIALTIASYFPGMPVSSHLGWVAGAAFPYTLFSAICVWRCAEKSLFLWRWLSRLIVTFSALGGAIYFVILVMRFTVVPSHYPL